jgi:hypothetical protein
MSSIFQKAKWTDEEIEENGYTDEYQMYFEYKSSHNADIAFMERQLEYFQRCAKELKETIAEKKEIVKEKLQKLKEDKTLSKKEKEIQKRKILNKVFSN